jgi:prevent-host-death family protein
MDKMKTFTATEAKKSFGELMTTVKEEPITISKTNKDIAVMISAERYKELKKLEDILYGRAAEIAISEGLLSAKESQKLLDEI